MSYKQEYSLKQINVGAPLDDIDLLIMIEIQKRSSLREIAAATLKAVSSIQYRLERLEHETYIVSTPGKHRSRVLTQRGAEHVSKNSRPNAIQEFTPGSEPDAVSLHRINGTSR